MRISKTICGLTAVALLAWPRFSPAAAADSLALSARANHYRHHFHHYRHYGGGRAALRMFGMMAGTIASIAAAQEARDEWRHRYYYGYPPPPYGYDGYGPYYPY